MAKTPPIGTKSFTIPWSCLPPSDSPPIEKQSNPKTQKSFADAVNNVCDIPESQFPKPCIKGDRWAIPIPEDEYIAGIETCKHNLHARIIWPKGSTPLTVTALREKLKIIWKGLGRWGVMSLGKGFYEFTFSSLEDVRRVRSVASWNINPGLLKLFAWTKDFNPNLQQHSSAQVWVRIYGLSQEYWRPKILFAIVSSIGTPICTDGITNKPMFDRTFGHFARVLVDIDLTKDMRYKVLVERKGFAFFVELDYENLPDFCAHCKTVGHHVGTCRRLRTNDSENQNKDEPEKKKEVNNNSKRIEQGNETWKEKKRTVIDLEGSTSKGKTQDHLREDYEKQPVIASVHDGQVGVDVTKTIEAPVTVDAGSVDPSDYVNNEAPVIDNVVINIDADDINKDSDNVNNEEDDASSNASEFVDATQLIGQEEALSDHETSTPERVQKDMQFLHDSWANLAEKEDEENRVISDQIQQETNDRIVAAQVIDTNSSQLDEQGYQLVKVNSRSNRLPNLWCICSTLLNPSVVASEEQFVAFTLSDGLTSFAVASVYASTYFNTIIGVHEYRGSFSPARIPIEDFQVWTDTNNLVHLPTKGAFFTWANGRNGSAYTQKRLDRAIVNQLCWNTLVVGCPMFILSQKLKMLKDKLRIWNKDSFGNVQNMVRQAEIKLQVIQDRIDGSGHSELLMKMEKNAQMDLNNALNIEEMFWLEKSRVKWHLDGDRNTAYFHRMAKIKSTTKTINAIRDGDIVLTEPTEIANHIVNYYQNLFSSNNVLQENNLIEDVIPHLVDDQVNKMLISIPYPEEIRNAVFDLNKDSAPGPDGFGGFFYQTYWDIIQKDVCNAVMEFFNTGFLLP
ncbi:DUF4283 domain protein, partial [Trifolium medium]|nr:DUF4283 domain protein [Trifolium medium]